MSRRRYYDDDGDEPIEEKSEFEDEELDFERTHRHREPMKAPHDDRDLKAERRGDKLKRRRNVDRRDASPFVQ